MRITELEVVSIKGCRTVRFRPLAGVNTIAGDNGCGKTSILDSIAYALGGAALAPPEPITTGEDVGIVRLCLDGDAATLLPPVEVVRRFERRPDGTTKSTLTITDKSDGDEDSNRSAAPQTLLNDALGRTSVRGVPIGFDPLAFQRMNAAQQGEILRNLAGLDFSELDAKKAALIEERLEIGREGKALAGLLAKSIRHDAKPVDVAAIKAEYDASVRRNKERQEARDKAASDRLAMQHAKLSADSLEAKVSELKKQAKEAEVAMREMRKKAEVLEVLIPTQLPPDEPTDDLVSQIESAAAENAKVADNQRLDELRSKQEDLREAYASKTADIHEVDATKLEMLHAVEWPVNGLGLGYDGDGGATYNERPICQASSAEQLEVSVSVGCALNPGLKVMLVREGSLLDEAHREAMSELAEKHGAQIFVEAVGEVEGSQIIMRDGEAVFVDSACAIDAN